MTDLLQIIRNLVAALDEFQALTGAICFLIGFVMAMSALKMAQKRHEMGAGQGSWSAPITTFIIAALFISLPSLLNVLNVSMFGVTQTQASSIFAHADSTLGALQGNETARELITGLVMVIQFMGIIAVARGLYLLNQSAQGGGGPKTFGPGFTFVIAGAMATNFPIFVGVMESLITA